jgi:hypothetical protein
MPYKAELGAFVADWWQFGAFLVGGLIAYVAGRERQRFRVDQIGQEVRDQGERIAALEKQGTAEAVQLAQIVTTQQHILTALDDIKRALQGKADK